MDGCHWSKAPTNFLQMDRFSTNLITLADTQQQVLKLASKMDCQDLPLAEFFRLVSQTSSKNLVLVSLKSSQSRKLKCGWYYSTEWNTDSKWKRSRRPKPLLVGKSILYVSQTCGGSRTLGRAVLADRSIWYMASEIQSITVSSVMEALVSVNNENIHECMFLLKAWSGWWHIVNQKGWR